MKNAVNAAAEAFKTWKDTSAAERSIILNKIADRIEHNLEYIATVYIIWKRKTGCEYLFGLKTNQEWNPFWSAGLSWIVSNDAFYNSDFLPYLKLRGSYGFKGNIDPSMVDVPSDQKLC